MPEISVIVPVYNAGPYLRPSLDSILAQSFQDFEVLLLDDGSSDGSGSVCDEYAAMDGRIRVHHQANQGVSFTRNLGLDLARGDYLAFVDGDDIIEPDMLSRQLSLAKQYGADMVCCDFAKGGKAERREEVQVCAWEDVARHLLQGELRYTSYCTKLYRRELKRYLYNREAIRFTEDLLANYRAMRAAKVIVLDETQQYHYIKHQGSAVQSVLKEGHFDALRVSDLLLEMEAGNCENLAYCRRQRRIILTTLINRIIKSGLFRERYASLRRELLSGYSEVMREDIYSRREKVTVWMLKYCPGLYRLVVKRKYRKAGV